MTKNQAGLLLRIYRAEKRGGAVCLAPFNRRDAVSLIKDGLVCRIPQANGETYLYATQAGMSRVEEILENSRERG